MMTQPLARIVTLIFDMRRGQRHLRKAPAGRGLVTAREAVGVCWVMRLTRRAPHHPPTCALNFTNRCA